MSEERIKIITVEDTTTGIKMLFIPCGKFDDNNIKPIFMPHKPIALTEARLKLSWKE